MRLAGSFSLATTKIVTSAIVIVAFGLLLSFSTWIAAKEPLMNPELMEKLAGEPVVNVGSDGLLVQLPEDTPELISTGVALYGKYCSVCHGSNLQGQTNWQIADEFGLLPAPPHDATGHTWHHADDQLFEIVKYGPAVAMRDPDYRSRMPAFESLLADDEILSILLYLRSTWPKIQRQWQKGANEAQTGNQWWRKETTDTSEH